MQITIFGATGAIGRIVTDLALADHQHVTAYIRPGNALPQVQREAHVITGELTDESLMEQAISGADVVISTMGPPLSMSRRVAGTPIADGTQRIVQIMERQSKKRLIVIGTPTVRSEDDKKGLSTSIPGVLARILYPAGYLEMRRLERSIRSSSLDWTVVRFINPNLRDMQQSYDFTFGDTPAKFGVSRENIGRFIYRIATDGLYVRRMPIVFNK